METRDRGPRSSLVLLVALASFSLSVLPFAHAYYTPDYTLEAAVSYNGMFGNRFAIDQKGETMVVGTWNTGGCQIYRKDANTGEWVYSAYVAVINFYNMHGTITPDGKTILCRYFGNSKVFDFDSATQTWVQRGGDLGVGTFYHYSISDDGNTVALSSGIRTWDGATSSWVPKGQQPFVNTLYPHFAYSSKLSPSGNTIVVAGYTQNAQGVYDQGTVMVYDYHEVTSTWVQRGPDTGMVSSSPGEVTGLFLEISPDTMTIAVGNTVEGNVKVFSYRQASSSFAAQPFAESWVQMGETLTNGVPDTRYGVGLSLTDEGTCVAVGAPGEGVGGFTASGATRIYTYDPWTNAWTQVQQELVFPLDNAGVGEGVYVHHLSPNTFRLYAGGFGNASPGRISTKDYTFTQVAQTGVVYPDHSDLFPSTGDTRWGSSTSASKDGKTVAIGTRISGGVHIYRFNDAQQKWVPSATISYTQCQAGISSNGNFVVVAAYNAILDVWQYDSTSQTWQQKGSRITTCGFSSHAQKPSISDDGNTITGYDGCNQVSVWTYDQATSTWVLKGNVISTQSVDEDWFGFGLYMTPDGNNIIAGAMKTDLYGRTDHGLVRVFYHDPATNTWIQRGGDITDENTMYDPYFLGANVELSDDGYTAAVLASDMTTQYEVSTTHTNDLTVYRYDGVGWKRLGNTVARMSTSLIWNDPWLGNFLVRMRFRLHSTGTMITVSEPYVNKLAYQRNGALRIYMYDAETDTWEPATDTLTYPEDEAVLGYGLDVVVNGGTQATVFAPGHSYSSSTPRFHIKSFTLPKEPYDFSSPR